jgi:predicted phage terminase large subunit-like protein
VNLQQELIACDEETVRSGRFIDFIRLCWPQAYAAFPLQMNWHIPLIAEHYTACYLGQIKELVVNIPPAGSKSSITGVLFPLWVWAKTPERSFIMAAYGDAVINRDARLFRQVIQSKWWQDRWGLNFQIPTKPAVELIENNRGGFRLGTTPGGAVTGYHANYQIIDDPIKPEDLTKVGLETAKNWLGRTMGSRWRLPPEVNSRILIMQRLHCDDPSQTMLDNGAVHICLPANFDPARRTVTTWGRDPRTKPGELFEPNRLPQEILDKKRIDLGPMAYAAQYDQSPVPEGGAVFKGSTLRFWSTVREGKFRVGDFLPPGEESLIVGRPPQWDQQICSWDCAFKDEAHSDYVAGQAWGRVGAGYYLLDQLHGHFDFGATQNKVKELALRFRSATVKLVEDKANGTGVIATLTKEVPGLVAVDPQGGKFSRASACSGLFEAGNVYLPDPAMPGYEWVAAKFIPEVLSFPRAKHDDQVDAMTQALLYMLQFTSYLKAAMETVRRSGAAFGIT